MTQWTTPTFGMRFPVGTDFSETSSMVYSLSQGPVLIEKKGSDVTIDENVVLVSLSQREAGKFKVGDIEMQVNWLYPNGARGCSNVCKVTVDKNLHKEVME